MTLAQLQTVTAVQQPAYPFDYVPTDDESEAERYRQLMSEQVSGLTDEELKRDFTDAGWS